jgi:ParB-like nuclease domain
MARTIISDIDPSQDLEERRDVPLTAITLDERAQTRARMSDEIIAEYAAAISDGARFPDVVLYSEGKTLWMSAGFHRWHAHKQAGKTRINALIRTGTLRDAILHAVGSNATHGLRRSNEDKERAARLLLQDPVWTEWSDREIARRAGVSAPTVGKIRRELVMVQKPATSAAVSRAGAAAKSGARGGAARTLSVKDLQTEEPASTRKFERGGRVHEMAVARIGKGKPKAEAAPLQAAQKRKAAPIAKEIQAIDKQLERLQTKRAKLVANLAKIAPPRLFGL